MDIAQYISDLLKENDEVGLPGIGTFFKKSISAYFNSAEETFYPPSYQIDFKEEEASSTILIDHIIQSKHISESSALYFIERFCENVNKGLDKSSSVDIAPLGTLSKSENGYKLQSDSRIEGPAFFGLKPVKETQVVKRAPAEVISQTDSSKSEVLVDSSPSSSKGIWITLCILLLIAVIGAIAYFKYPQYFKNLKFAPNKKTNSKVVKPVVAPVVKDSLSFADSIASELEKQGMSAEVKKAPDTVKISSKITNPDSLKVKPKPSKVYEIIVASFGLKKEAEASVRGLRKKGIDAKVIVDTNKPKFKVSIGTFTSKSVANKESKRIQQELNKEAWILTIKQ